MTDDRKEPAPDAGINAIRLDADKARNELEDTLDQIEARLNPQRVIAPVKNSLSSAKKAYRKRPTEFIAVAAAIAGTVGGLAVWAIRSGNGRG